MKTTNFLSIAFAVIAFCNVELVAAATLPAREVRINNGRFAELTPVEQERVLEIKGRLETLLAVDRSTLEPVQRAELRNEWKELKGEMKELNRNGNVIYISTAGLIIIILLLIILL